jgi:hypothetical protein
LLQAGAGGGAPGESFPLLQAGAGGGAPGESFPLLQAGAGGGAPGEKLAAKLTQGTANTEATTSKRMDAFDMDKSPGEEHFNVLYITVESALTLQLMCYLVRK